MRISKCTFISLVANDIKCDDGGEKTDTYHLIVYENGSKKRVCDKCFILNPAYPNKEIENSIIKKIIYPKSTSITL